MPGRRKNAAGGGGQTPRQEWWKAKSAGAEVTGQVILVPHTARSILLRVRWLGGRSGGEGAGGRGQQVPASVDRESTGGSGISSGKRGRRRRSASNGAAGVTGADPAGRYASEDERAGRAEGVEERRCDGGNSRDDVDRVVAEECESTGKRWSCRILREIGWHAGIGHGFAAGRNREGAEEVKGARRALSMAA